MQPGTRLLCVIIGAAALLSACGDKPAEEVAQPVATAKTQKPPQPGAADQVAAVTMSGSDAPVTLRFALLGKPRINEPVQLDFSLQATRDVESAQVSFEPNDAIDISSDNPFFSVARTAAGESASYKLTLVPKKNGVLTLIAIATTDLPTGPVARTFSIPIIVTAAASPTTPKG